MIDFALLGHPANAEHLAVYQPHADRQTLLAAFESLPPFVVETDLIIPAPDRAPLRGKLIVVTFLPENMDSPNGLANANHKTREACRLAKDMGAKIVGLGGFTSIAIGPHAVAISYELNMALTSGNSLTAALALRQVDLLLSRLGWNLKNTTVAVLGAGGDIGRACAIALAPQVGQLIAVGRNVSKLRDLSGELAALGCPGPGLLTSINPLDALEADILLAATSAGKAILAESDLRPGAIVCDISYPKTLAYSSRPRDDVLIFSGGISEAPFSHDLAPYIGLPLPYLLHGCFSETIVLALAGRYESYSIGQRQITVQRMQAILDLAQAYGFLPAPLFRGEHLIDEEAIETFCSVHREVAKNAKKRK